MNALLRIIALFLTFALGITSCSSDHLYENTGTVHIKKTGDGYELIRNGKPFTIRGASGRGNHLDVLSAIGGNTIRLYDTTDLGGKLDDADANDLAVIVGIPLPKSHEDYFYSNDSLTHIFGKRIQNLIRRYKDHPAVLLWCLGNETLYYDFFNFSFGKVYSDYLQIVRDEDPNHPVGMAMGNFSKRAIINLSLKAPDLDLLLINTFGRIHELEKDMRPFKLLWDGPFIVGEYGEQGHWETDITHWAASIEGNSLKKRENIQKAYLQDMPHKNPRFLGSLVFYWGYHHEYTDTWFNFFSQTGETNICTYTLAELWGNPIAGNQPPLATKITLDGSEGLNDCLFNPGEEHVAEITISDPEQDTLKVEWAIKTEDWYFSYLPSNPIYNLITNSTEGNTQITFKAPPRPGPYRISAKITDGNGHFATINKPFYVVPNP